MGRVFLPIVALAAMLSPLTAAAQAAQQNVAQLAQDGWTATTERRYGDALEAFTRATSLAPREPTLWLGAGNAAAMLGQWANAREYLERALMLQPGLTEASLRLGEVLYSEGSVREAVAVYEEALKRSPGDTRLEGALAEWRKDADAQSRFYQAQGAHFSVLFEGPSDDALATRIVEMLDQAYYRLGSALSTYPTRTVTVVLYTREQFRDITRSPAWAGALYDGRIKIPIRGALDQSEELQRVLEHELVHATVATICGPTAPAWLNEGLATALEPRGLEWAAAQLARNPTRVPYSRLANGFEGLSASDASAAYAQSAVAVKKMIDLRGTPAVVSLLQALGRGTAFEAAFQQTIYMQFQDFMATLRE